MHFVSHLMFEIVDPVEDLKAHSERLAEEMAALERAINESNHKKIARCMLALEQRSQQIRETMSLLKSSRSV